MKAKQVLRLWLFFLKNYSVSCLGIGLSNFNVRIRPKWSRLLRENAKEDIGLLGRMRTSQVGNIFSRIIESKPEQ